LNADGKSFLCPCHTSAFDLQGKRMNQVPPRGMDTLEVAKFDPKDPESLIQVKFQRFRTMSEEKVSLA
jgi:menaquinol-cytochrome c reductase iron-sulfur subunit